MIRNYAHRGFSGRYPENTLLAFEKALAEGVDGIENDVQLTRDGEIIIIHDESVDRTTNGTGWVKDLTLAEIKELDAGGKFDSSFSGQRVPTLREYFELVKEEPILTNIEMKTGVFEYREMERLLVGLIREYRLEDRVLITSFNHFTVMRMKQLAPDLKYGFLAYDWRLDAGEYTRKNGIPCYHPDYHNLTWEVVEELASHGIEVNPYTVDDPEDIRDMMAKGVHGIITNRPDVVNEIRGK